MAERRKVALNSKGLSDDFDLADSQRKKSSRPGRTSAGGREPPKGRWLKPREYVLLMIEAAVSVASEVVQDRYSAILSMVIGCIADSYIGHYTMAFLSVALHFFAICILSMEVIIKWHPKGNLYTGLSRNIYTGALVLMKSTDFTRLVYALGGLANRKISTIYLYLFLHFWVSSYATYGGIMSTILSWHWNSLSRGHPAFSIPIASFTLTSLSMLCFVYYLRPFRNRNVERGLGFRIVGCLLMATYRKIRWTMRRRWTGFFYFVEDTYDQITIAKTKQLLALYGLLLPTIGLTLLTMLDVDLFYEQMIARLKTDNPVETLFMWPRIILCLFMLISYFGMWPLLTLLGIENKATPKFLIGYLLITLSFFYATIYFSLVEHLPYSTSNGLARIFNTRDEPVSLIPQDKDSTIGKFQVEPKAGFIVSYVCFIDTLFAVTVVFNENKNLTTYLSITPGELTGYVVVDPPKVMRIRGPYLPLREGPRGTNAKGMPRIFFYNVGKILKEARITIRNSKNEVVKKFSVPPGIMKTIALHPAAYQFNMALGGKQNVDILEGAFYGVIISPTYELLVDRVVEPSDISFWPMYCRYAIEGLGAGLGYPTLRGIIYILAPQGLMSMSFAFLAFLEGLSLWVQSFGFKTWHYFVTGGIMFVYSVFVGAFYVLCMYFSIKYIKIIF